MLAALRVEFFATPKQGSLRGLINKRRNYRYETALEQDPQGVARYEQRAAERRRKED